MMSSSPRLRSPRRGPWRLVGLPGLSSDRRKALWVKLHGELRIGPRDSYSQHGFRKRVLDSTDVGKVSEIFAADPDASV